jgi:hypothetical protein
VIPDPVGEHRGTGSKCRNVNSSLLEIVISAQYIAAPENSPSRRRETNFPRP